MASSPDFVALALELLDAVGPVEARRMFGGHGVYAQGVMFGLLDDDELFLKTDALSRPRFVEAGCRQWVYVAKNARMENTSYFRPPDAAHDDPDAMAPWARLALDAALRLRAAKTKSSAPRPRAASGAAPLRASGKTKVKAKVRKARRAPASKPRARSR